MQINRFPGRAANGFTLIELIMVIVIMSVLAVTVSVFLSPMLKSYRDTMGRAGLLQNIDNAAFQLQNDVRRAVANSVRNPSGQCIELVPSVGGGRYRIGPNPTYDASTSCSPAGNCSAWIGPEGGNGSDIDILGITGATPATSDFLVINNQNVNDVYNGVNLTSVSQIQAINPVYGLSRWRVLPTQFPTGYDQGRFAVVAASEPSVSYTCVLPSGAVGDDAQGVLYRSVNATFSSTPSCPSSGDVIAKNVAACSITYSPSQGLSQNGFVRLYLTLKRNGESVHLSQGVHVSNVP